MNSPYVTVGVPVRNGESDIGACLDCLTRQTFSDIAIFVYDNASTDHTPEIVATAMRNDPRISYFRHETNIGALANFSAVLAAATSPYFMWRADDDLSDVNFVEEMVRLLDANPNAALAVGLTVLDKRGRSRRKTFPTRFALEPASIYRAPLNDVKIRQAIGFAIDRDKIIKELLSGQAKIAYSVLPNASWAYSPGIQYNFDPARSKQLLQEAGYKNEPIKFKYAAANAAFGQYAQAIQNSLTEVGLNVQIETLDPGTLREQLKLGQFQINTGVWIGGNQDPIFLKDLFTTGRIPGENVSCCNRARYSNPDVDRLIDQAINEIDRSRAKELYIQAWSQISSDLPLLPLWYPANMVVANRRIGNIKISPSGDWTFIKDITVSN